MSWLSAEDIHDSGPSPDEQNREFVEKHGELGALVLNAFENVNPAGLDWIEGDEYLYEVGKFIEEVSNKDLSEIPVEEVEEIVKRSFHPLTVASGRIRPESIKIIARGISGYFRPPTDI